MTASPDSLVMRNPRGVNSLAGSFDGPNQAYSSTGGVRAEAAARPRSSDCSICAAFGWTSIAHEAAGPAQRTAVHNRCDGLTFIGSSSKRVVRIRRVSVKESYLAG